MHSSHGTRFVLSAILAAAVGVQALASCEGLALVAVDADCCAKHRSTTASASALCCVVADPVAQGPAQPSALAQVTQTIVSPAFWALPPAVELLLGSSVALPVATHGHGPPVRTALLI